MRSSLIIILSLFFCKLLLAQVNKDGVLSTISNTIVNQYYSVTSNINAGDNYVVLSSASGLSSGDLILIIQMQGASVNSYANPSNTVASLPNANYGAITSYNNAGNYEFNQVLSVNGNSVNLICSVQKNYTASGKVQVVRIPRFSNVTINPGHVLYGAVWNGNTGGVVAIEVSGTLTINSGGKISSDTIGFRGGITNLRTSSPAFGVGDMGHLNKDMGVYKGESIAGDTGIYALQFSGRFCKGAVANGGGGGNAVNAGGGGGANAGDTSMWNGKGNPDVSNPSWITAWNLESPGFASNVSSGGGRGGYTYSNSNKNPLTFGPNDYANWGGDGRSNNGGLGGRPLDYASGRVFLGGGGGAGDSDNGYAGKGGSGGGIIFILNYGQIIANGLISANGRDGYNTSTPAPGVNQLTGRDGGGGGGGGGAIIIKTPNSIVGTLTVTAKGGNGGNQQMKSGFMFGSPNDAYGPGGGGGGGYIGSNVSLPNTDVSGGNNGIVQYLSGTNGCLIDDNFPPNGATKGGAGIVTNTLTLPNIISVSPATINVCVGSSISITATATSTSTIEWFASPTSTLSIATGSVLNTNTLSAGTYTFYAGQCPGTIRAMAQVTVSPSPNVSVNSATICSGQSATLVASGASSYTWNTGATTNSIVVSPTMATNYTVTGGSGSCVDSKTTQVIVNPSPTISVNSATICSGQSATLIANGASSYTWNTGAMTNSIVVFPTSSSTYTVIGEQNNCVSTQTTIVVVNTVPTLTIIPDITTVCQNNCVTFTYSPSTYSNVMYNYGSGNTYLNYNCYTTMGIYSITATGTYTNSCLGTTPILTINVVPNPVADFDIPTEAYSGETVTFTNQSMNAQMYNWSFGNGNSLITYSIDITHSYISAGDYCVLLTAIDTAFLCSDTITKCIKILDNFEIEIPNIFTPNNDGTNDVFKVRAKAIKEFYGQIYDRWGVLLFEWNDVNTGWNGYLKNNSKAPTGTYYYLIKCKLINDEIKEFKGYLTLLE